MAGGKGGTGKTVAATSIADYFCERKIPLALVDCDLENQRRGGLSTFFHSAAKLTIRGERGMDELIDHLLESAADSGLIDLGAGSGADTHKWFAAMGDSLDELGIDLTLVTVITSSPAAIQTLYDWASELKSRCKYVVVKNCRDGDTFPLLDDTETGATFLKLAKPSIIKLEKRASDIQAELETRRLTVGQALAPDDRDIGTFLAKAVVRARLRGYFNRINAELDRVQGILIP